MTKPAEIVLIEDYEPDILLLLILLRKNRIGNKVHVIRDGAEAQDFLFGRRAHLARSLEHSPLVVLLDTRLPKVDGWEVLRQLKQEPRTRHIPVITLSGSMFTNDCEASRQLGAAGCLQKPVRFDELRLILAQFGFQWLLAATSEKPPVGD